MPLYDMESFDKPNEYIEDVEKLNLMHTQLKLKDSLLCIASEQTFMDKSLKTIASQCNLEFEFKREKIYDIKS